MAVVTCDSFTLFFALFRAVQNGIVYQIKCFGNFDCKNRHKIKISFRAGLLYRPGHAKMCLMPYANNKGAAQSAHPRSLISTLVVRWLDSMICILTISKVSRL